MEITLYSSSCREIWNDFMSRNGNGLFMFHRDYMEYHADRFEDHSLMFHEAGRLAAIMPACRQGDVLASHAGLSFGGLVCGPRLGAAKTLTALNELKAYMRARGFARLIYKVVPHFYAANPAEEDIYALFASHGRLLKVEPNSVARLSDELPVSELNRRARRGRRNAVDVAPSDDFAVFMRLLEEVLAERHGTRPVHSAAEMEYLRRSFPEAIKLYLARNASEVVAGAIFYETTQVIHTQYLAANEAGRRLGALDMLLAEAILNGRGAKEYFSFGISTEQGGLYLNNSLIHYKEGFGARTVAHLTWELPA